MSRKSARTPNSAEPTPATPQATPKNKPETKPIFPGRSSCAYTRIAENADDKISPTRTLSTTVQNKLAYGIARLKGAAPRIENQITYLRPYRSPNGPPM